MLTRKTVATYRFSVENVPDFTPFDFIYH